MTTEAQYAQALFELAEAHPEKSGAYMENLRKALEHKGHLKLLPKILAEYERLLERRKRTQRYSQASEESERTRVLLELYRTLVLS